MNHEKKTFHADHDSGRTKSNKYRIERQLLMFLEGYPQRVNISLQGELPLFFLWKDGDEEVESSKAKPMEEIVLVNIDDIC